MDDKQEILRTIPANLKQLRACMSCSLIKSADQFEKDGCDNCDTFLHMKGNKDAVIDCTSTNFDGMIAAMSNEDSWVCRWQRINPLVKGMYAISVAGRLPSHVLREMKRRNIPIRNRDTRQMYSST
ncbi:transcription elongation factor SPT4-A [Cloeon dipterum]